MRFFGRNKLIRRRNALNEFVNGNAFSQDCFSRLRKFILRHAGSLFKAIFDVTWPAVRTIDASRRIVTFANLLPTIIKSLFPQKETKKRIAVFNLRSIGSAFKSSLIRIRTSVLNDYFFFFACSKKKRRQEAAFAFFFRELLRP